MSPSYEEFYRSSSISIGIFIFLAGLILPALLIPLVNLTACPVADPLCFGSYSEVIEELAKAAVVLLLILKLPTATTRLLAGLAFGFLFGVSESFFYLNNLFQLGNLGLFWQRLLWTVPMHMITAAVIVLSALINKKLIILGFIAALTLHLLFNNLITKFF